MTTLENDLQIIATRKLIKRSWTKVKEVAVEVRIQATSVYPGHYLYFQPIAFQLVMYNLGVDIWTGAMLYDHVVLTLWSWNLWARGTFQI